MKKIISLITVIMFAVTMLSVTPLRCLVKKYESVSHSVMSNSSLRAVDGSLPSSSVHGIF